MLKKSYIFTKAMSLFLSAVLCFSSLTIVFATQEETTNKTDAVSAILATAINELGYSEGINSYTKYGEFFGSPNVDWCAAFVAWCARTSGIPEDVVPSLLSSTAMRDFFIAKGLYNLATTYGGTYIPKPGDIVFFTSVSATNRNINNITHVGLVLEATSSYVTCIEGNFNDKVQQQERQYTSYIVGFATPQYEGIEVEINNSSPYKPGDYITQEKMNFRKAPNGEIITLIPDNTILNITEVNGVWGKTEYENQIGWLSLQYSIPYNSSSEENNESTSAEESTTETTSQENTSENQESTTAATNEQEQTTNNSETEENTTTTPAEETTTEAPNIPETPEFPKNYRVTRTMNFRNSPSTTGKLVGTIPEGTIITVSEIADDNWGKTIYDGITGWIKLDWSSEFNPEVNWLIIDISQFNAPNDINWQQVKEAGVKGVIIRVGGRAVIEDKKIYDDSAFMTHYSNAKQVGMHVGVYFFSYALTKEEAIEEAQYTLDVIKKNKCVLDLPIYIDIEDYGKDKQHQYAGKEVCSMVCNEFCNTIESAGYISGIYCNDYFAKELIDADCFNNRSAWIADWTTDVCKFLGNLSMWQYTEDGSITGIKGDVDLNKLYVNYPKIINENYEKNTEFILGDVDFSGTITANDARLVLRYTVKLEYFSYVQIQRADINQDSKITSSDAREILIKSVRK